MARLSAKARSLQQAGIPEWHLHNAQAFYQRHGLSLIWAYAGTRRAGWALQGFGDGGPGVCIWGLLHVDIEEACDAPGATLKQWREYMAREEEAASRRAS